MTDSISAKSPHAKYSLQEISPLLLMVALFLALMIAPIVEQRYHNRAIIYAGVTLVLVIGVFVNGRRQVLFVPSLVLAILTIGMTWSTLVFDYTSLFVMSCLLGAGFYALLAGILMIVVLKRHLTTVPSVFGAVCVYLLLGLAWGQLYWAAVRANAAALHFPPRLVLGDPFAVGEEAFPAFSELVYFSFVTMSTLGYGDIYPQTPVARTLTWMQSVVGQFYVAVLVAWIVNSIRIWGKSTGEDLQKDAS